MIEKVFLLLIKSRTSLLAETTKSVPSNKLQEASLINAKLGRTRDERKADTAKLKAMVNHWSQQMSAAVNSEASRNITRKASKMVDIAKITQRDASAAID